METSMRFKGTLHPNASSTQEIKRDSELQQVSGLICNLIEYVGVDPDGQTRYAERSFGCLTVYSYGDDGGLLGYMTHHCVPNNFLLVAGKHGIGCGC